MATDDMGMATIDGIDCRVMLESITNENENNYFCTFIPESPEQKKMMYTAMSNPKYKLAEYINGVITLTNFFCEFIKIPNEKTGELNDVPRCVLFDDMGESYQSVSMGVFNSLKGLIRAYGPTDNWGGGLKVKVRQVAVKNGSMLTLDIA